MLLTGFQGYGGRADNPSEQIAHALHNTDIDGERIIARTLPVTNHNLRSNIDEAITEVLPQSDRKIVLCLGLAPGEPVIRLERLAANHLHFEIPDNAGERCFGPVCPGNAAAYESTLPLQAMHAALCQAGTPARISSTAGTFLCNALMYHALDICHERFADAQCGFIHLPYLPQQVATAITARQTGNHEFDQGADAPSMALEMQRAAVQHAISAAIACAEQARADGLT